MVGDCSWEPGDGRTGNRAYGTPKPEFAADSSMVVAKVTPMPGNHG
jgi:hypothetical protein